MACDHCNWFLLKRSAQDLLSSALGGNLTDLQEVHLSHKVKSATGTQRCTGITVCTGILPEVSLVSQGLEDITAIGSAPNVVNVNVSVSLMRPHSAVQTIANVSDSEAYCYCSSTNYRHLTEFKWYELQLPSSMPQGRFVGHSCCAMSPWFLVACSCLSYSCWTCLTTK